jgi:hypothetical protein
MQLAIFKKYLKPLKPWAKDCFTFYVTLGTWESTMKALERVIDKVPSIYTVIDQGWRYAIYNIDDSYQILKDAGLDVSYSYWQQRLVSKAYRILTYKRDNDRDFADWLKSNNLYEKYKDYTEAPGIVYAFPTEED